MNHFVIILTVFLSGAATMIFEIVGSRMMAPFFGSSTYTWSAIISVVLGSLSLGYYYGGKMSDRKMPTLEKLADILTICSLSCVLVYFFADQIMLVVFNSVKNVALASFLASLVIFSLPSFCFGIVAPFSARLYIRVNHLGRYIGNLYAISTVGSIIGTLFTGYYLTSVMDSYKIVLMISLFLMANAIALTKKMRFARVVVILALLTMFFAGRRLNAPIGGIIKTFTTKYNDVFIVDYRDQRKNEDMRFLLTDFRSSQSGFYKNRPNDIYGYANYFTLPECFSLNDQVLMIGGGGYSYPKYFMNTYPDSNLDVVEIDDELEEIAEEYFHLPKTRQNIAIYNEDGRVFLNKNQKKYDAILLDAFNGVIIPFHLATLEAVEEIYQSLKETGMVVANIVVNPKRDKYNFLNVEYNTYLKSFDKVELYTPPALAVGGDGLRNVLLVAYKGEKPQTNNRCLAHSKKLFESIYELRHSEDGVFYDSFSPHQYFYQ